MAVSTLREIESALVEYARAHESEFASMPTLVFRDMLDTGLKVVIQLSWTYNCARGSGAWGSSAVHVGLGLGGLGL